MNCYKDYMNTGARLAPKNKELKGKKGQVAYILKVYPSTRNNDGQLFAHYINTYFKHLVENKAVPLKNFHKLPSLETIRRLRQIIQNDNGMFLPTDEKVIKARKIKQKNWNDIEVREARFKVLEM